MADAGVVVVRQHQLRRNGHACQAAPGARARTRLGVTTTTLGETKLRIQVNLQGTYNVFPLGKLCLYLGTPAFREFARAGYGGKLFSCHRAAYSGGERADITAIYGILSVIKHLTENNKIECFAAARYRTAAGQGYRV
jgi:hypothetical protein